ncbi:MAG TPA: hypothetical protein PKJ45_03730 [Rubrivivax sp.]|nr:hypothetical protein [Burkholderiales bacterium]HNU10458.1 hypothetical protein [Rubrivivax sp.]
MARLLVLTWLCLGLAGCAPELNWRQVQFDEAGVSQLFPCKPRRQQRTIQLVGQPRTLVLQLCDAAGVTWGLAYLKVGEPAEVPAVLDTLAAAAHANLGAERGAAQPQTVAGAGGYAAAGRYRLSGRRPDGQAIESALLLYARGTVVVQLTALGPKLDDAAVDAFLAGASAQP